MGRDAKKEKVAVQPLKGLRVFVCVCAVVGSAACSGDALKQAEQSTFGAQELDRPYPAAVAGESVSAQTKPNAVFKTVPAADGEVVRGSNPLTVQFNNCQSRPADEDDNLKFTYDFDADGTVDAFGHCRWEHTYTGDAQARICVSDRRPGNEVCQTWLIAPGTIATGSKVSFASGFAQLCDSGLGSFIAGCQGPGNQPVSYFMDFDGGDKVLPTSSAADLSKGHGTGGLACCNWFTKNGAAMANTGVAAASVGSVTCGPSDGRSYSLTEIPYGQPNSTVVCLRTADGAYVKFTGRASCCGDITIDWVRFEGN